MKENGINRVLSKRPSGNEEDSNIQGYPTYPDGEDIYRKYQQEKDINPEDISRVKEKNADDKALPDVGENLMSDAFGRDLDIPGSELDDRLEEIGSEDEENNYYSLGSDAHNGLEEDQGI